jgi:UDP-N-acetyl-D-glucosamine dehydrogenase
MKCGRSCTIADPNVIALARAVVSCVPPPLSEEGGPDLSGDSGRRERCGTEGAGFLGSTTHPSMIDDVVRPVLNASGLAARVDFNLAFSPERFDPGEPGVRTPKYGKVIGGHTEKCAQAAADFAKSSKRSCENHREVRPK